nr:YlbF family regulator [Gorillibacterium massiliense]
MSVLMLGAYQIGDLINASAEMADYLYWKDSMKRDEQAQQLIRSFARKKELFDECMRFGHFHPEYHRALQEAQTAQDELANCQSIKRFKAAEERLDELLYEVSRILAVSVSETVKVSSNNVRDEGGCSGGCSTGGSCSGKCG